MRTTDARKQLLWLPDPVARTVERKRYAGEPDLSTLKGQQVEVYAELREFLMGDVEGGMHLLEGFAGTGKTYVLSRLIEEYLYVGGAGGERGYIKIAMTAPVNKAVKVLKASADYIHNGVQYLTVHKLLGLKEKINADGTISFVKDWDNDTAKIDEYDVLVVDEVSMLSDELFEMLEPYSGRIKILFSGDPAQIPPVGRPDCIPLREDQRNFYRIGRSVLTEPQRQTLDSPILENATKLRDRLKMPTAIPRKETKMIGNSGIAFFGGDDADGDLFEEILYRYFTSENFKQDADFAKVIGWRNRTLKTVNSRIRSMIYEEDAYNKLVVGEKLVANAPIAEDDMILFTTNDEFVVEKFRVETEKINGGQFNLDYYSCTVNYMTPDGNTGQGVIKVVHEESQKQYDEILEMLGHVAKNHPRGSLKAVRAWQDFWAFKKHFADVSYNYAITGHKSQGSTYSNAIVLENDINANNNVIERNRIKYTAMSRPKDRLLVAY